MDPRELTFEKMKTPGTVLINRKQLLKMIPLSERTIYDMELRGEFPRRFAITSRMVAWDLREIQEWIEARKAEGRLPDAPTLGKRK